MNTITFITYVDKIITFVLIPSLFLFLFIYNIITHNLLTDQTLRPLGEPQPRPPWYGLCCGYSLEQMILSANQPYFSPFTGFFYKAYLSDIFVILDEVQFPRGTTWLSRNRFKNDQGILWITVPVWKKGLGLQKIDEVRICHEGRWTKKHLASLKTAYAKAPYFADHLNFLEKIFSSGSEKLIELNLAIIRYLMKYLHIDTEVILLSELGIKAKGDRLLIEICMKLGADHLLVQSPAKKYLNEDLFRHAGIQVKFFTPPSLIYPQLWGDFIPNLSALDLILNCGTKAREILLHRIISLDT